MEDRLIERLNSFDKRLDELENEVQRLTNLLNEFEHATLQMVDEKIESAMIGTVSEDDIDNLEWDLRVWTEGLINEKRSND
ncbi:hypothetical protein ACWOA6_05870 [Globicatella sulfidifaciens]|uniref:Uncharacterized protein n=1 Tax=Globicatella sulfidifaciens DSM 15739 TaxID=1121925 RepID=A0A1T4LA46_9LACT|nr:hypothetical protein [Globicatella sulfidifaciens]SJZ51619.1 hypothetical protein SAMN02746011_01018 [Globicatella sulfidifaciens DSM 15739]